MAALLADLSGQERCRSCDRELGEHPRLIQQQAGDEWVCAPCAAMVAQFVAFWRIQAFEAWLKGAQVFSGPAK